MRLAVAAGRPASAAAARDAAGPGTDQALAAQGRDRRQACSGRPGPNRCGWSGSAAAARALSTASCFSGRSPAAMSRRRRRPPGVSSVVSRVPAWPRTPAGNDRFQDLAPVAQVVIGNPPRQPQHGRREQAAAIDHLLDRLRAGRGARRGEFPAARNSPRTSRFPRPSGTRTRRPGSTCSRSRSGTT